MSFAVLGALCSCSAGAEPSAKGNYTLTFDLSVEGPVSALSQEASMRFVQQSGLITNYVSAGTFSVGADGKAVAQVDFKAIPGAGDYTYAGIYPKDAVAGISSNTMKRFQLTLKPEQDLKPGSGNPPADLLFSKAVTSSATEGRLALEMRRVAAFGMLKLSSLPTYTGEKIRQVEFIADGVALAGDIFVNLETGDVLGDDRAGADVSSSVRLSSSDGIQCQGSELTVVMACLPCTLKSGQKYSVRVVTESRTLLGEGTVGDSPVVFRSGEETSVSVVMSGTGPTEFVTYEEYGAKGDGKTDDMPAIIATHDAANASGLPVKARAGAKYLIGNVSRTATIKTDTYWDGAEFIVNDVGLDKINSYIFKVMPYQDSYTVSGVNPPGRGQTKLGITLPCRSLLEVINADKKVFIRSGGNQNSGSNQMEMLVVDTDGTIDPSTPVIWDFEKLTSVIVYPIDDKPLVISGGKFTTIANQVDGEDYFSRGILIRRSRVIVRNFSHYVTGEGEVGSPYHGFLNLSRTAYTTIQDCTLTGHKTYYKIGALGKTSSMGSYDVSLSACVNVNFLRCVQSNDIYDESIWGIMGSNFCKSLIYDSCRLSRFDAHQGCTTAEIRNSTLAGLSLIGFGTFTIEDSNVYSQNFMKFRGDYGASWDGDIIVRNTTWKVRKVADGYNSIVNAYNTGKNNYGYECRMPRTFTFENFTVDDSELNSGTYEDTYIFSNVTRNLQDPSLLPYIAPEKVTFSNLTVTGGHSLVLSPSPEFYANTEFIYK